MCVLNRIKTDIFRGKFVRNFGKTIQIYLPDGNPRSLKIAEITSRTVSAVLIPRSKLDEACNREELNNVGIYLLFGNDGANSKVYVGEAEKCLTRLKQHNKYKEFWTHAIVFISKTQYFTKTHIKFLEWFCYQTILKVNRYSLDNSNTPTKPHVSESVEADLYDNFETIQILASTLGYPIFDEIKKPKAKELIICKGKDAYAEGEYTEDGIIVFSNSICTLDETRTINNGVKNLRKDLIDAGILLEVNGVLKFTKDYIFSSPSSSAGVILARSANGWVEWKYKNGKTLDAVKRQND